MSHPNIEIARQLIIQATAILEHSEERNGDPVPQSSIDHIPGTSTGQQLSGGRPQEIIGRPTVLQELRRSFQPYQSNRRQSRNSHSVSHIKSQRCFCLSNPGDMITPKTAQRIILCEGALGDGVISFGKRATVDEVIVAVEDVFPKLRGSTFEMLRSVGGGQGKPLIRVSPHKDVLSGEQLSSCRIGIIYLCPLSPIDEEETADLFSLSNVVDIQMGNQTRQTHVTVFSEDSINIGEDELATLTLEDLQSDAYHSNPGEQLLVMQREEWLLQLFGLFKSSYMDLLKKPKVVFIGEIGNDCGALSKEFFYKSIRTILSEKYNGLPLFEGPTDHKVPCIDAVLLRDGVFEAIGKFIGYCCLHSGVGFIGLSSAVVSYLCEPEITHDTCFPISIRDVPDFDDRQILKAMGEWDIQEPNDELKERIKRFCRNSGFNLPISGSNAKIAKDTLLYTLVIDQRKSQLDSIKSGFKKTVVYEFLKDRQHLLSTVFIKEADLNVSFDIIWPRLQFDDQTGVGSHVQEAIKDFILEITSEPGGGKLLLSVWTGWPLIPSDDLKVTVISGEGYLKVSTCFNEIKIPVNLTKSDIMSQLQMVCRYGSEGFGSP